MFWVKFVLIVAILVTLGIMILLFIAQKTGQKVMFLKIVEERHVVLTQIFGKYWRSLETPGVHFVIPGVEQIKTHLFIGVETVTIEQVINTKNLMELKVTSQVMFQVVNPYKAVYNTKNYKDLVLGLTKHKILTKLNNMDFEMIKTQYEDIAEKILAEVRDLLLNKFGIDVQQIRIEGADPIDPNVKKAMAMRATAPILQEEAKIKAKTDIIAKGGEGKALAVQASQLAKEMGIGTEEAKNFLVKLQEIEAMKNLGNVEGTLVLGDKPISTLPIK